MNRKIVSGRIAVCAFFVTVQAASLSVFSQMFSPQVEVKTAAVANSGPLTPMWLTANQWDLYREGAMAYAKVGDTLWRTNRFHLRAAFAGVLNFPANESFVHEGYLGGKLYFVDFSLGLEAFSPTAINDQLTSGMFLGSANARPIPRLSVGIYDFTHVPFVKWLEVKGGISQGYLDDYPQQARGHQKVWLHEKFAYFRVARWEAKPYIGLIHSALYGGKGIKTDFWATFFASGSSKLGGGEFTNAAGAHMGMYDFGVDYRIRDWDAKLYFQKPFADGSGMRLNTGRNRDWVWGLWLQNGQGTSKLVKGVSLELIKTTYQSGPGFPDPYDAELVNPDNPSEVGVYFYPGSMDDPAAFMAKFYPDVPSEGWDKYDITAWLEDKVNHGYHFGGRDDYMNNGMYYSGWSYYGRSTGTPLFHTADQVRKYAPDWEFRDEMTYFVNNRIKAFHLGVEGELCTVDYRLKATYTKNFGSYSREYFGRSSWQKTDAYFYRQGLSQFYLGLDLEKYVTRSKRTKAFVSVGVDSGQLYDAWGAKAGLEVNLR